MQSRPNKNEIHENETAAEQWQQHRNSRAMLAPRVSHWPHPAVSRKKRIQGVDYFTESTRIRRIVALSGGHRRPLSVFSDPLDRPSI
eukprot:scaffold59512_cov84-Cyclotella_meneghiniana.AAC.2